MSEQDLVKIGHEQINEIVEQLQEHLQVLDKPAEVAQAVQNTLKDLGTIDTKGQLATPFERASEIANTLNFLRLAASQRSQSVTLTWLEKLITSIFPGLGMSRYPGNDNLLSLQEIDKLIQSCYQPAASVAAKPLEFQPEEILAVYFESEYLARPNAPVPFLLVPDYFEGYKPEEWVAVGHETGHYVYRHVPNLRYEIEILVTQALLRKSVSAAQQRLWFNWLEETFADLYGILTLGAASVYALHLIIRNYASPNLEGLLMGGDKTHPNSLVRGEMAVYIYEQLLQNSTIKDLQILQEEWKEITDKLVGQPIHDPHTPKSPGLEDQWNSSGELDYSKTVEVMKLVVDTLLTSELRALSCKRLNELVDFIDDEKSRQEEFDQQRKGVLIDPTDPKRELRFSVAAARLIKHRQ